MKKINTMLLKLRIMKDTRGQDLIEYALMAGFVAVAAGAIVPSVASSISTIFGKVNTILQGAAAQGGGGA
jgi:pilus assembly protein Flp/PilA